jgi:hypothetical protein
MNDSIDTPDTAHVPSPEFRAFLEYEVTRAAGHASRRNSALRWARVASLAIVCIAVGMTTAFASAQVRSGARRDSLLESARADLQIAGVRLELAQAQAADAARRAQAGAEGAAAQRQAELELRTMQAQAMRAKYNIDEITRTAQSPRDDFSAPLVGDRDFVRDRLQLEAMVAQERLKNAEAALQEAQRRVRVGADDSTAQLQAEERLTRARADFSVLAVKLGLRKEFLEKHTPVDSLLARLAHVQLQQDVLVAQERTKVAREQLDLIQKRHAVGQAADLDLLRAKLEMQESQIELKRLVDRLRGKSTGALD